jgi:hypothetical protein
MKKVILSLFIAAFSSFSINAQNGIEIMEYGQSVDLSGDTLFVVAPSYDLFDVEMVVWNNTGSDVSWKIRRLRLDIPAGWGDGCCWGHCTDPFGGLCFSSGQMDYTDYTMPNSAYVAILDGECGKLKPQIDPHDFISGQAHYRYYLTADGSTYVDSIDVKVDFVASVQQQVMELPSMTISPNPAADYAIINVTGIDGATMKIVDVLGNVIAKEAISGTKKLDLNNFRNGVYFVMIEAPGIKTMNRKLIVKH